MIIPFTTKEAWLANRLTDVTSTETAALFNIHPRMTEFELWHHKRNVTAPEFEENERIKWGKRLEAPVALGIAEDLGLKIRQMTEYIRHDSCAGMGSSFDYEILDHSNGRGILEIKTVDGYIFKKNWQEDEAPAYIELQVQHQMEVANIDWCLIGILIGGNEPHVIERKRDREMGKIICDKITEFWKSVYDNSPPKPIFEQDAEFIIKLHQSAGDKILDADDATAQLLKDYIHLTAEAKSYADMKEAKKAEILEVVGDDYNKVTAGAITLHCGMTKDTPAKIITPDMVGTEIGGRKGYRSFRLIMKEAKNETS